MIKTLADVLAAIILTIMGIGLLIFLVVCYFEGKDAEAIEKYKKEQDKKNG